MSPSNRKTVVFATAVVIAAGLIVSGQGKPTQSDRLGLPHVEQSSLEERKARLGRQLFMDARLSASGAMACATCHVPEQAFTQNDRKTPNGRDGRPLRRNAPTLLNVGFARPLMHDGAAPSLEVQVLTPLLDGNEMANRSFQDLEERLAAIADYADAFRAVFGESPSMARIGEALAAYQRSLVAGGTAFDRWAFAGDAGALAPEAQRGLDLFKGKGGCVHCHQITDSDALFTDNAMHNTGVGLRASPGVDDVAVRHDNGTTIDFSAAGDRGRHEVTQIAGDLHRFRTPTLRNVALTAPYMHDGSLNTLEAVVRFYNFGGGANANLDPAIVPLALNDQEIKDLVAFLTSLTGSNVAALAEAANSERRRLPKAVSP